MKRTIFCKILLIMAWLISFPFLINGSVVPTIYTDITFINLSSSNKTSIVWIIIDDNPKNYWITMHENNSEIEEYLENSKIVSTSKIEFFLYGFLSGTFFITLHLIDYSGNYVNSTVAIQVLNPIYSSIATSTLTSPTTTATVTTGQASYTWGVISLILLLIGFSAIKIKKGKN